MALLKKRNRISKKRATRGRVSRKQIGGNKHIAFYTCFFGHQGSNSDKVPHRPSKTSDCFYFTNNAEASKRAEVAGWTVINVPVQVKGANRNNAMDSKEIKVCPHHFKELNGYTYTCYFDSKLHVDEADIHGMLGSLHGDVVMLLNKHPFIEHSVYHEFEEAMKQPRYAQNMDKYKALIDTKIKNGAKDAVDIHYETSCILRKSGDTVNRIGDEWIKDIQDTGCECQISFFFIQQKYTGNIGPLPVYYGRA